MNIKLKTYITILSQNNKADDSCKMEIDFGDLAVRMAETEAETLVPAETNQLDCLGNVVEADQRLEQQPIVENEPTSISQLSGRRTSNPPDRYGVPVALIADVYEVTNMMKLWHC